MKKCKYCGIEKPDSEFQQISKTCKECERKQRAHYDEFGIHADLSQLAYNTTFDVRNARELLTDMGYDISGKIPVWEQFYLRILEKYDVVLKPREIKEKGGN